ncbi:FISUMP domain-containing protein [Sphingobacterium oryzagri]|uniref:FISUMP domain-containing protein n=1 Tax=Sphingobacterium oryzagri TaxID=3025669 RepID=A0ABY7WCD5_9SPHI|nr:FISUMP domain-containing protein [Sphingobacterium sp. KACC 22765]WDF67321.1 FISUMP domain-containing protein [Sphingobacterium sp. KACC 22765]
MKYYAIVICTILNFLISGCADKTEPIAPVISPAAEGTFVDTRDQNEYKWVRYAGLDWMAENSRFNTRSQTTSRAYQPYGWDGFSNSTENVARYGYLYTLAGARLAAPAGWRVPTDADWKSLEQALGMTAAEADARGWRGSMAADLMKHTHTTSGLAMLMSGYYTPYTAFGGVGYRLMGSDAFFWTDTSDPEKAADYAFYRKLFYDSPQVYRESMETGRAMLSVRFVRDATAQ